MGSRVEDGYTGVFVLGTHDKNVTHILQEGEGYQELYLFKIHFHLVEII